MTNSSTFADRVCSAVAGLGNCACLGLDPHLPSFPKEVFTELGLNPPMTLGAAAEFVIALNAKLIEIARNLVPAVKLQSAFYEALGSPGVLAMRETIKLAKTNGLIVLLDAKRADIGHTADAYAQAYLGRTRLAEKVEFSVFDVDAITVNPYLGMDGLQPFAKACVENDKGIFVVVRSSNPSAEDIQELPTKVGTVSEAVAGLVNKLYLSYGRSSLYGYGPFGVVIGATAGDSGDKLRSLVRQSLVLVPGYGAQGGTRQTSLRYADSRGLGAIVSSSRSLLYGPSNGDSYFSGVEGRLKAMTEDLRIQSAGL